MSDELPANLDVDWIYRAKVKKHKKSSTATNKASVSSSKDGERLKGSNLQNVNINQNSTRANVNEETKLNTPKKNIESEVKNSTHVDNSSSLPSRSLLSKALRQRSNSDPKHSLDQAQNNVATPAHNTSLFNSTGVAASTIDSKISSSLPKSTSTVRRSNSLNEKPTTAPHQSKQTSPPLVPPTSTVSKPPRKSLFSAFAKLKNKSAPTSPQSQPISIPNRSPKTVSQPSDHSNTGLPSSIESISPISSLIQSNLVKPSDVTVDRVVLNKNPNKSHIPLKQLHNLNLKRVTFALDKLLDDPPQQIPSRRPRMGNVLIPENIMEKSPLRLSVGITNESKIEQKQLGEHDLKLIIEARKRFQEEAEKHAQEAHIAARRIAHEVANYKKKGTNSNVIKAPEIEETEIDAETTLENIEIDKPIHLHEHHFEGDDIHHESNLDVSLETIYTRCCHLREILPIPATLKQLRNKTLPLMTLKMLNPKPTLIDIYSFTDFASIVEIKTLTFDNVSMTQEMLKVLFSSIIHSKIEKLSLRNVLFNEASWKFLCKFLVRNKFLTRLDISQQKIKSDVSTEQYRSEMDWDLFIDSVTLRGGLDELILNGCKFKDYLVFRRILYEAISVKTTKLGLAQCDLNYDSILILREYMENYDHSIEGLDLGYNDLSYNLKLLIKSVSKWEKLQVISLNSTQLSNVEDAALFIKSLSKLPNLKFLDLGNLASIFPGILPYLKKYLPRFPNLLRIHFDHNELTTKSISLIASILPKCPKLIHVSIVGNTTLAYEASASLYGAIRSSSTIMNFDLDYDLVDEKISSRIAICLMKNMQKNLNNDDYTHHEDIFKDSHDDILFDGSLLAEIASNLLGKMNSNLDANEVENIDLKFLTNQFLGKVSLSRKNINRSIDELLNKRSESQISLSEKESLLRLYFLDNSLGKIEEIFNSLSEDPQLQQQQLQQMQIQHQLQISKQLNQANSSSNSDVPHQMALDTNGNQQIAVDIATGKPILLRSLSQTSVQGKRQEEEEGEFHRWGFFVQQQRQIMPREQLQSQPIPEQKAQLHAIQQVQQQLQSEVSKFIVPKLPSGSEIRDAVIKAKGIESINTLIDSVNNRQFSLDKIYPTLNSNEKFSIDESREKSPIEPENYPNNESHELKHVERAIEKLDILSEEEEDGEVDEAYDKLLNDISRVRSNK
ncbi:hypothetical protein WICMUC_003566 [Wickerhamomyces mucosus]|uniref:GLC7-interacting protein 3 n=1 Tax=Wickerhamomyces mucosus TaxID=1378264 RepID=A0A9P8PJY1_9ASCO|nr:hypothetical protein WICMUC_003566 [Wickerhamomyces mucosus]